MTTGTTGASTPVANYQTKQVDGTIYGPNTQYNVMNYSYPLSPPAPTPALVLVHGGSWEEGGGYTAWDNVLDQYASYGFFTATIDYRVLPTYQWPAMIADVRLAIRYLRENAAALNINPNEICVEGDSAGGELAQIAGYDHDGVQSWDVQLYTTQASDAQCVVSEFGPQGGPGGSNTPSQRGLDYVDAQSVPTWITQGADDTVVNAGQSIDLYNGLAAFGIQRTYLQYAPGDHEFAGAPSSGPSSEAAADKDHAAWILSLFGLANAGLYTTSQLPACPVPLDPQTSPGVGQCFVTSN